MFGPFKRKPDPISDRARQLEGEIRKLEKEISQLSGRLESMPETPRLRSTVRPRGGTRPASKHEPVFEEVDFKSASAAPGEEATPDHFNELGVRKYDLAAALRRWKAHFRGPASENPRLINYLASGSIHGLRPLRYEKRVARNRFIVFTVILVIILFGLFSMLFKR